MHWERWGRTFTVSYTHLWGWDRAEACLCLLRLKEGKWEEAKEHLAKADGLAEQIRTPETLRLIGQLKEKLDEQDKHGHK